MRTGAGLRNAFLFLLIIIGLHVVIVKPDFIGRSRSQAQAQTQVQKPYGKDATARRRAGAPPTSTMLSDIRRRQTQQQPSREYMEAWPPGPDQLADSMPVGAFQLARQTPYTLEDEERAALHRLVFSQPDSVEHLNASKPAMMPDYSGLHMAAETSITSGLPMHYIRPGAQNEGNSDHVSGMLSWGAGYQPVMA